MRDKWNKWWVQKMALDPTETQEKRVRHFTNREKEIMQIKSDEEAVKSCMQYNAQLE